MIIFLLKVPLSPGLNISCIECKINVPNCRVLQKNDESASFMRVVELWEIFTDCTEHFKVRGPGHVLQIDARGEQWDPREHHWQLAPRTAAETLVCYGPDRPRTSFLAMKASFCIFSRLNSLPSTRAIRRRKICWNTRKIFLSVSAERSEDRENNILESGLLSQLLKFRTLSLLLHNTFVMLQETSEVWSKCWTPRVDRGLTRSSYI